MTLPSKTDFWLMMIVIVPGCAGICVFGTSALVDWAALQTAYTHYEQVVAGSSDLRLLFAAEAEQNIHRLNLFADGVWTLLSAILAAIGLLGVCLLRQSEEQRN